MTYHDSFQYVINKYSHDLYVINLDKNVRCKCHIAGSDDPDPACKYCLGTGHRIFVHKVRGAAQTSTFPDTFRATNQILITTSFYLLDDVPVRRDDIIVYDNGDYQGAYIINDAARNNGFNGKFCYTKASGIPKKLDNNIFFQNFHRIIG